MANTMRIGFKLANFSELRAMLLAHHAQVEKKVIGVALEEAARPIEVAARRLVSVRTGALRRSITHTLRQYKNKSVVIIGPDRDYYEGGVRLKKGDSKKGKDRPANYAHLVEFGHLSRNAKANALAKKMVAFTAKERAAARVAGRALPAAGRRTVDFVPARPFLRPAVAQGEAGAAAAFERGVAKGLVREIKKLNRKIITQRGKAA